MALKKNFVLQFHDQSMVLADAYCKVWRVSGDKENLHYDVNILDKKDGTSYRVLSFNFTPLLEGENFIAQAYNHAKTLPEFQDATDC
jgi:hypothetical protein